MNEIVKHYEEMVKQPGKFEGEPRVAPYFYNLVLNGEGEQLEEGCFSIKITPEDCEIFPELEGYKRVILYVDNDGFVYGEIE